MTPTKQFVEVAVMLPIRRTFVYEVPEEMKPAAVPGKGVWIPFGRRFLPGYVLGTAKTLPPKKQSSRSTRFCLKIFPLRKIF